MLIKTGDGAIIDIVKDSEHKLDDEETRKALEKAKALENKQKKADVKETKTDN